ncbi:RNA-binding protein 33-like [Drosophila subpulchrella]|uniref:RNA-binding protein 33-like n=1 Tax=Drosophila subpulchrella TaxID=1486046 RepID=UPI0018A17FB1|nr:RNA-binding protein 33-like [Drosophila subpulchrella]
MPSPWQRLRWSIARSARRDGGAAVEGDGGVAGVAGPTADGRGGGAAAVGEPGVQTTPRYAPEPCIPPPEVAEDWAPSPSRWLPEIPPSPRYEGSPQWTPARPPTPRLEQPPTQQQPEQRQQQQLEQPPPQQQYEQLEQPPAQQQSKHRQQPQRELRQQQQPDPPQQQQGDPMGHHIRTDIPAAHSTRTSIGPHRHRAPDRRRQAPGRRRQRQQGQGARLEPRSPNPWVWPEPVEGGRPSFKRQHSAPEVSEVVARTKLSRTVSAPEGTRWREIEENVWLEGIAEAPAVREARIRGGRRSVRVWRDGREL